MSTLTGNIVTWHVENSTSGIEFTGTLKGNTISGSLKGPTCKSNLDYTSGDFFGGRIVK